MSTKDALQDILRFLYPSDADRVHTTLEQLLAEFTTKHPVGAPPSPRFSPADIVLICYADHVQEDDGTPLQTLRAFLKRYVKDPLPSVNVRPHLLPFYPYSSDDGFSVIDYCKVHEKFGDWDDIAAFAREFSLMFDLVINHVSSESDWFQNFIEGKTEFSHFFIAYKLGEQPNLLEVFRPRTHPLLSTVLTKRGDYVAWTTFSEDQIDLNYAHPDVLIAMIRVLLYYVEHGATAIRLDAIAFLWKEVGTRCIHLPQTHAIVRLFRSILDRVAPDVWIVTETNVPHSENIGYFGDGSNEAHLVYNFALSPLLIYSLLQGNATYLTEWAKTLTLPSDDVAFLNFGASHDGIGVSALRSIFPEDEVQQVVDALVAHVLCQGGKVSMRAVQGQVAVPYELNIAYLNAAGGVAPFLVSQAVILALKGVPAVYFSSLIGGENAVDVDPDHKRAINRERFRLEKLSAELDYDPVSTKHIVYMGYMRLLRARCAEPLFSPLANQEVLSLDPRLFTVLRSRAGHPGNLIAVHNLSAQQVQIDGRLLGNILGKTEARDIIGGDTILVQGAMTLEPFAILWIK